MIATRLGSTRERLYASTTDTFDGDLDLIAIEYALNGEPATLTLPEKLYAARILDDRGFDVTAIARRVGAGRDTVTGWKNNGWKPGKAATPKPKRQPPKCGEARMYRKHLRDGETPCDACRAANSAADRRLRNTGSSKKAAA